MKNIDDAFQQFEVTKNEIDNFIKEDHNESDTRSKIIDNYLLQLVKKHLSYLHL